MGRMAEVWLGASRAPRASRQALIKRILPHLADDDNFITMFEDEAPGGSAQPPTRRAQGPGQSGDVWYLVYTSTAATCAASPAQR